jgi:hypothetical protein
MARIAPTDETRLNPSDLLLLPEGVRATIRNDASAAATLLAIALHKPGGAVPSGSAPAASASAAAPVVTTIDLAGGPPVALPRGPAALGLGRATMSLGGTFPVAASGVALVVVEAGNLGLADIEGTAWSRRGAGGAITTATDGILAPGDATMLDPGASAGLRNAGPTPLVLLVVTIAPTVGPSPASS